MASTTTNAGLRDRLLSAQEVADYLGLKLRTIYAWNTKGTGPRRFRCGTHVRYRLSDVDSWLEQQVQGGCNAA